MNNVKKKSIVFYNTFVVSDNETLHVELEIYPNDICKSAGTIVDAVLEARKHWESGTSRLISVKAYPHADAAEYECACVAVRIRQNITKVDCFRAVMYALSEILYKPYNHTLSAKHD